MSNSYLLLFTMKSRQRKIWTIWFLIDLFSTFNFPFYHFAYFLISYYDRNNKIKLDKKNDNYP